MGLDWIVIARSEDGVEINPTDILGVRRASQHDPEVVGILRNIHRERNERTNLDEWIATLAMQNPPPIVVPFGPEAADAIPGVSAEAQYYGFRGKALEPEINRISARAAASGESFDWLWQNQESSQAIRSSIERLSRLLGGDSNPHPQGPELGKRRFDAWCRQDAGEVNAVDEISQSDPDLEEEIFSIFSYLAAIRWLSFWQDKGFKIEAEY